MNFAHLHLILTHFPPVLSLGSAFASAVGVVRRRRDLVHLALVLLIATGAMMPVVYIAGERTAQAIGRVRGVQQEAIAPHERAATIALSLSIGAALIAAGVLLIERRRGELSWALRLLVLFVAIASAAPIGWAAALGGEIHHPEIHQLSR